MLPVSHYAVVGGSGFIGYHLVNLILSMGHKLTVIEKKAAPDRPIPKAVTYLTEKGDEKKFLRSALQGVDYVVHLAYTTVPKTSFEHPVEDILGNLPPRCQLLRVLRGVAPAQNRGRFFRRDHLR